MSCSWLELRGQYQILLSKLTILRDVNHPSPQRQMTSILPPSPHSSLYLHYSILSSSVCLRPTISFFYLPFYRVFSITIIPSPSVLYHLLPPESFLPTCTENHPHTSSSFVFSVPFCRHYLRHHSHSAVSACLSSHHLSLHFLALFIYLFIFCSGCGEIQAVGGHLLTDLTEPSVAVTLSVAAGIATVQRLAAAAKPRSQLSCCV